MAFPVIPSQLNNLFFTLNLNTSSLILSTYFYVVEILLTVQQKAH